MEHAFATKVVIEQTIPPKNNGTTHLLLLDLTKAFDSINQKFSIEDLKKHHGS